MNECESLMGEIMRHVQAPAADPHDLLSFIGNLSSSSVDAPRKMSFLLAERLHLIAERHGGMVPLHSRLFAQWLHFAFPLDCPYPEVVEDTSALGRARWAAGKSRHLASKEAMAQHIRDAESSGDEETELERVWSDDEVMLLGMPGASGEGSWLLELRPANVVFLLFAVGSVVSLL